MIDWPTDWPYQLIIPPLPVQRTSIDGASTSCQINHPGIIKFQPNQCWSFFHQGFICHCRGPQLHDECLCLNHWVCFALYSLRFIDSKNKLNWKRKTMLVLCLDEGQAKLGQVWFRCCLSHPSRDPVSSAVPWLPCCPPDIPAQMRGLDLSLPTSTFPLPLVPSPQMKRRENLNPRTFKTLVWGWGTVFWLGRWCLGVQVCPGGTLYEEF